MSDSNYMFEFGRVSFNLEMTEIQANLMKNFEKIAPTIENRAELLRVINFLLPLSVDKKMSNLTRYN